MTHIKQAIVSRLPSGLAGQLRAGRKRARHLRYRVRQRVSPVVVRRGGIVDALRAGGVREGDAVFVHSALSRFGEIEGGAATVLRALEEAVGEHGTIAMPSFPMTSSVLDHLSGDPVFDVRHTPSRMGALTEYFRGLPGVERSLHPTHPVCARGPHAAALVAGHADATTPFGAGTPFARLVESGAHQVWFGTGIRTFTLYHTFEVLQGDAFPHSVFLPDPMPARCVDADGAERVVRTLVHDPAVSRHKDMERRRIYSHLADGGVLRCSRLGRSEVLVARLPELMRGLEELLDEGVTIYDLPVSEPLRERA